LIRTPDIVEVDQRLMCVSLPSAERCRLRGLDVLCRHLPSQIPEPVMLAPSGREQRPSAWGFGPVYASVSQKMIVAKQLLSREPFVS
jgi:hypothetical protein